MQNQTEQHTHDAHRDKSFRRMLYGLVGLGAIIVYMFTSLIFFEVLKHDEISDSLQTFHFIKGLGLFETALVVAAILVVGLAALFMFCRKIMQARRNQDKQSLDMQLLAVGCVCGVSLIVGILAHHFSSILVHTQDFAYASVLSASAFVSLACAACTLFVFAVAAYQKFRLKRDPVSTSIEKIYHQSQDKQSNNERTSKYIQTVMGSNTQSDILLEELEFKSSKSIIDDDDASNAEPPMQAPTQENKTDNDLTDKDLNLKENTDSTIVESEKNTSKVAST